MSPRSSPRTNHGRFAAGVLIAGLLLAVGATTFPDYTATHLVDRPFCLRCGDQAGTDLVLNLILFAPLGAGVGLLGGRRWHAMAIGAVVSLAVEVLQLDLIPGREASIRDLLANTVGAGMGAFVAAHAHSLLRPDRRIARALTYPTALVVLAALSIGAWSLRPDIPYRTYWVQWMPVRPGYEPFAGSLLQLELAGVPVDEGETLDPVRIPQIYAEKVPPIDALVIPGPPTEGTALIGRLVTARAEAVMLGRDGNDLVYRFSIEGRHLALRPPLYVLPGAFAARDTQHTAIHGSVRDGRVLVRACTPGSSCLTRSIPLSVSRIWTLVAPFDVVSERLTRSLSVLILGLLFLPLGHWGASWGRPGMFLSAAAGAAGLFVLPFTLALPPASPSEWIAVALGLMAGRSLTRVARHRP